MCHVYSCTAAGGTGAIKGGYSTETTGTVLLHNYYNYYSIVNIATITILVKIELRCSSYIAKFYIANLYSKMAHMIQFWSGSRRTQLSLRTFTPSLAFQVFAQITVGWAKNRKQCAIWMFQNKCQGEARGYLRKRYLWQWINRQSQRCNNNIIRAFKIKV